jgi:TPR repeat protein
MSIKCTTLYQSFSFFYLLLISGFVFGDELEKMAMEGNPNAQYELALKDMSTNTNFLSHWLVISALQGHKKASHYLRKLPPEENKIVRELKTLNSKDLSFLQKYGSIDKISKKELNTIRQLGNNGDVNAQFLMWIFYVNNKGVSKAEAWTWLKQAAGNNHPQANFSLGLLYYYGYIVPEEKKRATILITKSSELGFKLATAFLKIKNI